MSDNKRTRHKANREAALRVQAARETSGAGPSSTTASTRPQEASLQQKARFALVPIADAPKEKRQRGEPKLPYALRQNVVLEVANGQKYVQRRALPPSAIPGVSALDAFFKGKRPEEHGKATLPIDFMHVMSPGAALDGDSDDDFIIVTQKVPVQSRHHRRRVKQHSKWRDFVVPSLVHRYLAHKYGARVENDESDPGCRCGRQTSLSVTFVDWDGKPCHRSWDVFIHRFCRCSFTEADGLFVHARRRPVTRQRIFSERADSSYLRFQPAPARVYLASLSERRPERHCMGRHFAAVLGSPRPRL